MTIDEAIKQAEEVADKKEREKQKWERWLETDSDYRAVAEKVSCELCVEEHRQLAEWLKELKNLREQTRWIPVSERYPEDGQRILVDYCDEDFGIMLIRFNVNGYRGFKAWRPLPESYNTEREV